MLHQMRATKVNAKRNKMSPKDSKMNVTIMLVLSRIKDKLTEMLIIRHTQKAMTASKNGETNASPLFMLPLPLLLLLLTGPDWLPAVADVLAVLLPPPLVNCRFSKIKSATAAIAAIVYSAQHVQPTPSSAVVGLISR